MVKLNNSLCETFFSFYLIVSLFSFFVIIDYSGLNNDIILCHRLREHQTELEREDLRNLASRQDATFVRWFESRVSALNIILDFIINLPCYLFYVYLLVIVDKSLAL